MADFAVRRSTVRRRLIVIFILTLLFALYLISRLAWIQIVRADELYEQAWEQWNHNMPIRTFRGSIYDRHGRLLAGSASVDTVAAIPPQLEDPQAVAAALAPVLEMDQHGILELISMERSAVYIKRKVDPEVSEAVREMNIPGIIFFNEEKRYYPAGNLASQLLGFMGMDQGWAGLEIYYEEYMSGTEGRILYPADALGRQLPHDFSRFTSPDQGLDLYLAVDETIQHIVERELDWIMHEAAPRQAMALAVDPHDGAVLAVAARPDYNQDNYSAYNPENWKLPPLTSSFEPGSTFKMVVLAALIEEGLFDPQEYYHCPGYITVSGRRINCWTHDRGGHGDINMYQAISASCNPAFVELGNRLGKTKLFEYINAFGFGQPTGVDYPGESAGKIFDLDSVGPLELAATSFGQGISVTPMQQIMAVAAMVNGGHLYKPYLVEEIRDKNGEIVFKREPEIVRQVISKQTSLKLADLMESVILDGTGYAAALEGYSVAGKTGTAEKLGPDNNYMTDQFIYSFVGFAPVEDPRIVLFVAVDGVTRGPRFGSYTSAPLFKRIMEDTLNYLQVSPLETTPLIEDDNQ